MRFLAWAPAALLFAGCSGSTGLDATFSDELVEAPARAVQVSVFDGTSCKDIMSDVPKPGRAGLLKTYDHRYPLDPSDATVFNELPTDRPLTFEIVVRDEGGLQIARSCQLITIEQLEDAAVVEMRTMPICDAPPNKLDVMIVLDTSVGMQLADQDGAHIPEILGTVLDPTAAFPDTIWGLVTYGHENRATELVMPTSDLNTMRDALRGLEGVADGESHLFDGMSRATDLLRARAVCGRKPVVFAVVGFADQGSTKKFDDAQIGIVSSRGDATDDLFLAGVALTNEGFSDLDDLVPMTVEALVTGAGSRALMTQAFREVRDQLAVLRTPPTM